MKKKNIILIIVVLIVVAVISTSLVLLNIFNPKKLKGEVTEYPTYEVGDLFCLDTECFYTISDNGDTVTGLAQYNLLVGNFATINDSLEYEQFNKIPENTEGYGLQNSNISSLSSIESKVIMQIINTYDCESEEELCESIYEQKLDDESKKAYFGGFVPFANSNYNHYGYWVNENGVLLSKYENYPAYVYDENSLLYSYLDNYEKYFKNELGKSTVKISLLDLDIMVNKLGCSYIKGATCYCYNREFLTDSRYWLGFSQRSQNVYFMYGDLYSYGDDTDFVNAYDIGLRPVITVAKSDLIKEEEPETTTTEATTSKKVETTTPTTTKKEEVTTTKKKVVTTTTTETTTKTARVGEKTTTTKQNINKVVSVTKAEVKEETNNPIIPIGLGIAGTGAVSSILYLYFRKH